MGERKKLTKSDTSGWYGNGDGSSEVSGFERIAENKSAGICHQVLSF